MTAVLPPPAVPWERPRDTAVLAGNCAVLSQRLGLPVAVLRLLLLLSAVPALPAALLIVADPYLAWSSARWMSALSAPGLLGYAALWWALPAQAREPDALPGELSAVRGRPAGPRSVRRRGHLATALRWCGLALLVGAAGTVLTGTVGLDLLTAVTPGHDASLADLAVLALLACIAAGSLTLGLVPLADMDRDRRDGTALRTPAPAVLALLAGCAGLLLSVFAGLALVAGGGPAVLLGLVALAVVALLAVLLVPWLRRLWAGMREETEHRAVMQHQQETTAHLHDSVLQSLVILQRPGLDAEEVRRLARQQERELRRWLYSDDATQQADPDELRTAVDSLSAAAEDAHDAQVRTVVVGDAPLTDRQRPLLAALREAVLNACRHGGGDVDVFVDISPDSVTAFVRDRGEGFDMAAVPEDRLGVRESILGRMDRAGGEATVGPAPGGGTEVMLRMPGPTGGAA
jgi:signal transduction histidine kinase/phage shock protein PspC (stress-responsive transcriptional regulator)